MSKIVSKTLSHGMKLQEKRLAITANNLANARTAGYKAVQASFELHQPESNEPRAASPFLSSMSPYLDLSNAALVKTGGRFDLAIEGKGFFVITISGGTAYTRDGSFTQDAQKRLVTRWGDPVMGESGEIVIDGTDSTIETDGSVHVGGQAVARLKVVDFEDQSLLEPVGSGLLRYTGGDNGVVPGKEYAIRQGYQEASNVNVMREMANLIDIQRSFETYDKVKKMAGDTSRLLIDLTAK